jgi:hypothetical protein
MIKLCPNCGHHLPQPLKDGMSSCNNCRRAFDSSTRNKILSTSWVVRKKYLFDIEYLIRESDLAKEDVEFILEYVDDFCCNHDEFVYALNKRNELGKIASS